MAKIKYDEHGEPYLSGSVGKSLTFLLWRGVRVVKSKPVRRGPLHAAQIRLGKMSRSAAKAWLGLSDRERKRYQVEAGRNGQHTAYQAFVKEWWQRNGLRAVDIPGDR